jgi:hypothetical protein
MPLQHRLKPRADRLLRLGAILSAIACPALARAGDMAPRPSWSLRGFGSAVTQAFVGGTVLQLPGLPRIDARHLAGLSHSVEHGAFSARASVLGAELTVDRVRRFFDRLRRFGPPVQRTLSAGARRDFVTAVALKVQVDCIAPLDGARATFMGVQPGFRSGRPVQVASVVLDFVF